LLLSEYSCVQSWYFALTDDFLLQLWASNELESRFDQLDLNPLYSFELKARSSKKRLRF